MPIPDPEPDDEAPAEPIRAITVDRALYTEWARRLGESVLPHDARACRRVEQAGPWRYALDVADAWWKACGGTTKVHQHIDTGHIRIGTAFASAGPNWAEVTPDQWMDLADQA